MKIAVSSSGKDLNSQLDPRFGRASYFVIVDSDTKNVVDVIDNRPAQDAAHGAGINAATMVAGSGVQAVLTGRMGPKAYAVLQAAKIQIVSGMNGSISSVVDAFLTGNVKAASGPDSYAHQGQQMFQGGMGAGGGGGRGMGGGGRGGCGRGGQGGCGSKA